MKPFRPLSPNEGYVVSRLLQYAEKKTIAAEMGVGCSAVRMTLLHARKKYGAKTTAELLQMAAKREN